MTPKDVTEDVEQQVRPIRSRSSWLTLGRSLQGDKKGVVRHVEAFHRRTCFVDVVLPSAVIYGHVGARARRGTDNAISFRTSRMVRVRCVVLGVRRKARSIASNSYRRRLG